LMQLPVDVGRVFAMFDIVSGAVVGYF